MYLRRLEEKDAEGMLEWIQDPEVGKYYRFCAEDKKMEDVLEFIRKADTKPVDGRSLHLAIADESDNYLGTISLKHIDLISRNAEFAIGLRREAQGQGIGTKAIKELLDMAFNKFKLKKVYLNVFSDNTRAINAYEKCGFVYEGEFRKHLFLKGEYKSLKWYSVLQEEYWKSLG